MLNWKRLYPAQYLTLETPNVIIVKVTTSKVNGFVVETD
jgi:hypothetical protein